MNDLSRVSLCYSLSLAAQKTLVYLKGITFNNFDVIDPLPGIIHAGIV